MTSRTTISFYVDTLLVETVLAEPKFYKKAGVVSDLLENAKEYFGAHIDKTKPVESVLNVLAPAGLWLLFQSFGAGKWGLLIGLLMDVFHVDAFGLLKSLYDKVRAMISGGEKVSESQIDSAVESSAQEFSKPPTQQEIQSGFQALQQKENQSSAQADDGAVYSSIELMHDAKIISLALINYEHQKMRLTKEALDLSNFEKMFGATKTKSTNILARIFGWVVKLALMAAGLLIAGDVLAKMFGMPSALDHTYQAGQEPKKTAPVVKAPTSTQTKFKPKSDASLPRSWPLTNNDSNIENMLIQFAKDTYEGLDGKESLMQNSQYFQAIKQQIKWYNAHNPGSAAIFIPGDFTSKKQLVDNFIDDVARSSP
jgi:hypothetical protein